MPTLEPNARDARLDFRLSSDDKQMIEQAATATGRSISDFAVANLIEAARRTLDEITVTRMSMRDRDAFLALIDSDAEPNAALRTAAERYGKRRDR